MSDSDNEEKERIINQAIEMMTKRKGQPGIIRICRFVRRKYRMPYKETRRVVKKMVQDGNVVKENTEGEECYRNALKLRVSKISHKNEPTPEAGLSTEENPKTEEYKVVSQPESDVKETQVVGPDIYQNETGSLTMDQGTVPSPCLLEFALSLEECIDDSDPFEDQYPDNWNEYREAVAASLTNLGNGHGFFDVGRFDQDGVFRFIPEAFFPLEKCKDIRRPKRGSKHYGSTIVKKDPINDSSDGEKCDFCGKGASSNKKGHPEDLLKCKDCSAKAHPTCMDYGPELAIRSRLGPWQCINCKTCTVCGDSGNAESMLVCDSCDKGYHMSCHTPKIMEQPIGKWACQSCATELVIPEETNICSDNDNVTIRHSTEDKDSNGATNIVRNIEEDDEQCLTPDGFLENYPMVVPDATNWSVKDVERFVAKVGFPEQATVFRDQEIDGKSLLLLKRSDVLTNLSLRLGPALKIYKHVERLQLFLGSGLQH